MKHTDYLKKKKNREIRRRIVSILSALVVFVATYALVLPALTLDVKTARMEPGMSVQQSADPEAVSAPEESGEDEAVEEKPATEEESAEEEKSEKDEESVKEEDEKEDQSSKGEDQASEEESSYKKGDTEKADAEKKEDAVQTDEADAAEDEGSEQESSSKDADSEKALDQSGSEESEVESADAFKVPELEAVDFDEILTDKTDFYYYHEEISEENGSEDASDKAAVTSTDIQDWKKVKEDTILAPEDFVRVYLSYTIPAGALNETNTVARYRLPDGLELTDKQIKAINKNENGISGKDEDAEDYKKYLGAEAIEGTRTPDKTRSDDEYISATVKAEKVYKNDKYVGQDLVFTFAPYTVQKNQISYDEKGTVKSEGKAVKGWFTFDLTPSHIGFEEIEDAESESDKVRSEAKITFVKENNKKDIDEISRELTLDAPAATVADETEEKTEQAAEQKTLTYEGADYTVIINYTDDAEIPDNATLEVSEIGKDTPEYNNYLEQAKAAVKEDKEEKTVNEARFFDITILADGEKVEPAAPVNVKINFAGIEQTKAEDAQLLHYKDDEVQVMDKAEFSKSEEAENDEKAVDTVQFETDGFSVYGIVGTELITEVTLPGSDNTYEVSVTYGANAKIPENVHLEVAALSEDNAEFQKAKEALIAAKLAEDEEFDESTLGFAALDISIVDDETGEKIEPADGAEVKVSFKMKNLPENINEDDLAETLEIQHLNESTGTTVVETVAEAAEVSVSEGNAEAEFTVRNFSTFTITWNNVTNNSTELRLYNTTSGDRGRVMFYYVNSNGNAITRPTNIDNNTTINYVGNWPDDYEVVISPNNVARAINGRDYVRAYIIDNEVQKEITRILFTRTASNTWTYDYYNRDTLVKSVSGNNTNGNWRIPVYLQYSTIPNEGNNVTIHYGYMENGQFVEFADNPTPEFDDASTAYLIYDFDGYEFDHAYRNTDTNANKFVPQIAYNSGVWQYCTGYSSSGGYFPTYNPNYSNLADNDQLYIVYKKKAEPTQGGTPEVAQDELWPDQEDPAIKPTFSKSSLNQGDGTNLISLSIKGAEKPVTQATPADVIVIFDNSYSMSYYNMSGGTSGTKRLDLAKDAINDMANTLLNGQNTDVRMALVSFGTDAQVEQGFTDSYSTFTGKVNALTGPSSERTNWEKGLYLANTSTQLAIRENAATFVVFITDGDPTVRMSRGNHTNAELTELGMRITYYADNSLFSDGEMNEPNYEACYDPSISQVVSIVNSNKSFYAIGVSSDVSRLEQLMEDAGQPVSNAFPCTDEDALDEAFASITAAIKSSLGFGDIEIKDGITALTNMQLKKSMHTVDETSFKYYRYGGEGNKYGADEEHKTEWTTRAADGCSAASYNLETGCVEWNMGEGFQLEDGVTYIVTFRVWPSQAAYDLIADLNNGTVTYQSLDQDVKGQIIELQAPDLEKKIQGSYQLKTNTETLSAEYKRTTKTGGVVSISDNQSYTATKVPGVIENMDLTSELLKIIKIFDQSLDPRTVGSVTLNLRRMVNDDEHVMADYNVPGTDSPLIQLSDENEWMCSFYVAPGFIVDGETLEFGYKFTVTEPEQYLGDNTVRYDLIPETVNPMVVNGTLQLIGDGDGNQALTAINRTRSAVEIHKTLYDVDGTTEIYPDTEFTITGKLLDPDGNAYTNQETGDPAAYYLYDKDGNATTGRLHFADSGNISFKLKAGEFIRFVNVPEGCTFEFQESSIPDNYELDSLAAAGRQRNPETDAPYTYSIILSDTDAHLVEGETTISTTEEGIKGNTNYKLDFYNKRIIPLPDVELVKIDQDDNTKKLNGASFELHKDSADGPLVTTDGNGNAISITTGNKEGTTGPDGWYHIGLLPAGTYYMVETVQPNGYVLDQTPIIITVTKVNDSYSVTAVKGGTSVITGPVDGLYTITVSNEKSTKYIRVFKYETGTTIPLEGAEFSLTGPEGTNISYSEKTTNAEGYLEFDTDGTTIIELPAANDTYILNETEAPAGYNKIAENINFTVNTNGVSAVGSGYEVVEESATLDGKEITVYTIKVANSAGVELPHTGGPGTIPYTLGGIALIMASALMYGFRLRRRERRFN